MEEQEMAGSMAQGAPKLTYDDLVLFPDDGKRHEIIDGEHYVTPSPNTRHQAIAVELTTLLHGFVRSRGLGRVFAAPYDVVISVHDVVEPDLMFVAAARAGVITGANAQGAPDLVVEILSPSTRQRDEVLKRGLYERAGAEYWIVDPEADAVKVLRRDGGRFGRPLLLSALDGDVLSSPLLPDLEIALGDLFAE
jgi:Uma2 family endonuclease